MRKRCIAVVLCVILKSTEANLNLFLNRVKKHNSEHIVQLNGGAVKAIAYADDEVLMECIWN